KLWLHLKPESCGNWVKSVGIFSCEFYTFSIDDIEYVEASRLDSELVSLEVMEIVISKEGGIDAYILLTNKDDILREKLLNINLLISNIKALKDNPTPYSEFMTKSSSTYLNFLLEETNTFDNSLPESKTFCFDLEEISSGSTTTRYDISLPDYEAFYDDHVKEISSGSTTTHSDFSLYDLFIFDLSINPFPPVDRSDFYHEEFADELANIISPPEYDCFCFKNEPNSGDFIMDVVDDTFPTREPRVHVHNVLPTHLTLQLNLDFILSNIPRFGRLMLKDFVLQSSLPQLHLGIILSIRESSRRTKHDSVKCKINNTCWVIIIINPLNLTTASFGVDAAMDLEEKYSKCLMLLSLILRAYFDILSKSRDESRRAYRWFYHEDSVIVPRRVFTMG
nr:hypothetical protein [Tanacetum cinerariifolium]